MGLLSRFLGAKSAEQKQQTKSIPKTARSEIERIKNFLHIRELETLPLQAARAFQLASDPNSRLDDFVKVIEADEALSARIIRVANSVYYFRGNQALEIRQAVTNIGLEELRCLLSATMLKSLLSGRTNAREQIWANSIATAICARTLSSRFPELFPGEAFLCGLLHDVGKLIMIQRGARQYDSVIKIVSHGEKDFVQAEEEMFQVNHLEVGKWLGETWNFPDVVIETILNHHQPWPENAGEKPRQIPYSLLIKIADTISHAAAIGHPSYFVPFQKKKQDEMTFACAISGLRTDDQISFIKTLQKQYAEEVDLYKLDSA